MIDTNAGTGCRARIGSTLIDVGLTSQTRPTAIAKAGVTVQAIDARTGIHARIRCAFIDFSTAMNTRITSDARAFE